MKVSVIVPIYKVEAYIARCAESLFQQTLDDVEYIFVNDATPDRSMQVLKTVIDHHPDRMAQIKIVDHVQNRGLPAARNSGLRVATGDYVFHCDSDDFVELDMLEVLSRAAAKHQADIVWCDWFLSFEKNERYMEQPSFSSSYEALESILSGQMKYNVWNKLVRRSLYTENGILFPDGHSMGEDMTMIKLFACASKVFYVKDAFYHYVKLNTNALTRVQAESHFANLKFNLLDTISFIESKYGKKLEMELAFFKLEAKFPFLVMDANDSLYQLWKLWFPDANAYIWKNKRISFRSRFLQWMASKNQFWYVRLYYYVVLKFVYGVIYR